MQEIQKIIADGKVIALAGYSVSVDGIRFVTEPADPFQIGIMERPKGYAVEPHRHPDRTITLTSVSEFLFVEHGRLRVTFYGSAWQEITHVELASGDFIVIFSGGHSVEFLEDSRVHEVKQGPYPGDGGAKEFQRCIV